MPSTDAPQGSHLATVGQVADEIARVRTELADAPDEATATDLVSGRLAQFRADNPDVTSLDPRQLHRLVVWALDPDGMTWMAQAGLLATDSCGYPVAGGFYDLSNDIPSDPVAVANPSAVPSVMGRVARTWAMSYVRSGSADLDVPWREYLRQASE